MLGDRNPRVGRPIAVASRRDRQRAVALIHDTQVLFLSLVDARALLAELSDAIEVSEGRHPAQVST